MVRYEVPVARATPTDEPTVASTMPPVRRTRLSRRAIRTSMQPASVMMPAKAKPARPISTTLVMEARPPRLRRVSAAAGTAWGTPAWPASRSTLKPADAAVLRSVREKPCITPPSSAAIMDDRMIVGSGGLRSTAPTSTTSGGRSSSGLNVNDLSRKSRSSWVLWPGCSTALVFCVRPRRKYRTSETTAAGTVV